MKILLLKFRHIGDVLLATPLIENLAHHFPRAQIDFALNKDCAAMITRNPHIREVIKYDREKIKRQNIFARAASELRFALRLRRGRYDMIISLTEGDRSAFLALFCGAPARFGFRPPKGIFRMLPVYQKLGGWPRGHMIEKDLQFISLLGKKIIRRRVAIYYAKDDEERVAALIAARGLKKFVHVHAVSRWMFKCIADKTMAEVIDHCAALGYQIVITASPAAAELQKTAGIIALCRSAPPNLINLAGKLNLKEVGALNRHAKMFIGVDTAIMHLSAANNTPTFAFFGPSPAVAWGPWDNEIATTGYTKLNGIQRMGKHFVFSESRACQPCASDGCNHSKISNCLMAMDVRKIKQCIGEMLAEKKQAR